MSWGLVCVPGCVRGASASGGSGRGSCASSGDSRSLSTSVSPLASSNDRSRALRTPQANVAFPNANIENVTERSRSEMHGRLGWVPRRSPDKEPSGRLVVRDPYRPNVIPVTQPTVSKSTEIDK